jgi:hypothetical protein
MHKQQVFTEKVNIVQSDRGVGGASRDPSIMRDNYVRFLGRVYHGELISRTFGYSEPKNLIIGFEFPG